MVPTIALLACPTLAVPASVMQHVVRVESSFNPYAIGVVGGRLVRQPRSLAEAVATARMLESRGYNFSLGLAQVNRYNLERYGLDSYEKAFDACPNLQAGSRILAECHARSGGDWGKAFSCYYSGNFVTGYRAGYVQKVFASMQVGASRTADVPQGIALVTTPSRRAPVGSPRPTATTWRNRIDPAPPLSPAGLSTPNPAAGIDPARSAATTPSGGEAEVAVLNAAGELPSLRPRDAGKDPPVSSPAAPASSIDAAFVF